METSIFEVSSSVFVASAMLGSWRKRRLRVESVEVVFHFV